MTNTLELKKSAPIKPFAWKRVWSVCVGQSQNGNFLHG